MADDLDIYLRIHDLTKVTDAMDRMGQASQRMAAQGQLGSMPPTPLNSAFMPNNAIGTRLARAQAQMGQALRHGNQADILQAGYQLKQIQAQMARMQQFVSDPDAGNPNKGRGGFMSRIGMMAGPNGVRPFLRSSFNLEELLGGATKTLAAGGVKGGLLGGLIAGAAVVAGWTLALVKSTKEMEKWDRAILQSGSTIGEGMEMKHLLRMDPTQASGQAANLHKLLEGDSRAIMASAKIGGGGMRPDAYFDNQDQGKLLIDHLKLLRSYAQEHGALEALREARALHLEGYMAEISASQYVWSRLQKDAELAGKLITPDDMQQFRDFDATMKRMHNSFDMVLGVLGKHLAPLGTVMGNNFSDFMMGTAKNLDFGLKGLESWIAKMLHMKDPNLPANTAATAANTTAIMGATRGMYGGGRNAAGAIPGALKGELFKQAIRGQVRAFGGMRV